MFIVSYSIKEYVFNIYEKFLTDCWGFVVCFNQICNGVTCAFCFKSFKKLGNHTWRFPARNVSIGNNLSKDHLSNSLVCNKLQRQ